MKKSYYFVAIPLIISIGCFATLNFIGSYVAEDGTLVEPFALIPIGFFFLFITLIATLILGGKHFLKKK